NRGGGHSAGAAPGGGGRSAVGAVRRGPHTGRGDPGDAGTAGGGGARGGEQDRPRAGPADDWRASPDRRERADRGWPLGATRAADGGGDCTRGISRDGGADPSEAPCCAGRSGGVVAGRRGGAAAGTVGGGAAGGAPRAWPLDGA